MPSTSRRAGAPGELGIRVERTASNQDRVKRSYDAVAAQYDAQIGSELDGKPLDRALGTSPGSWPHCRPTYTGSTCLPR